MFDSIACRVFHLDRGRGAETVAISIGRPCLISESDDEWVCEIRIEDSLGTAVRPTYGIDSLQALRLAMRLLEVTVEALQVQYGHSITFLDDRDLL